MRTLKYPPEQFSSECPLESIVHTFNHKFDVGMNLVTMNTKAKSRNLASIRGICLRPITYFSRFFERFGKLF